MKNQTKIIIWGIIIALFVGVGIYNPEIRIKISEETVNTEIQKRLPIVSKIPILGLDGNVDDLDIKFETDGIAQITFQGDGQMTSGTTFSAHGLAISGLFYEEGKIYLNEPWIDEIYEYDYELSGKEKAIKSAYDSSKSLFNKVTGKEYTLKNDVVDKAKDKLADILEYIPVYDINPDNNIKGWILEQATGDIIIDKGVISLVLKPFGLLLKGVLFIIFIIGFTIVGIRNPNALNSLIRFS